MLTVEPLVLVDISRAEERFIRVVQIQVYGKDSEVLYKTNGKQALITRVCR